MILAADEAFDLEDVRRKDPGIDLDEVAPASPREPRVAQQVVNLKGQVVGEPERVETEVEPGAVRVVRIEVDDALEIAEQTEV